MNMVTIAVGDVLEEYKGQEAVRFDLGDAGAELYLAFKNLTENEIHAVTSGSSFQVRFVVVEGVIMMLFKFGDIAWAEAPYSPHIGLKPQQIPLIDEREGLALKVYLIEGTTGVLKHFRLIGLGTEFSRKLMTEVQNARLADFEINDYTRRVRLIQSKYTTKDLVKMSNVYWKLK